MFNFKRTVAVGMTAVLCAASLLQPLGVYAATLTEQKQTVPKIVDASNFALGDQPTADRASSSEGASGSSTDSALPSDVERGNADGPQAPGVDEEVAGDIQADGTEEQGDRGAMVEAQPQAARTYVENSWRYENGQPISSDDSSDVSPLAMGTLPEGANAQGIDVSTFQGEIDWHAVKAAGIDFAIIRLGWGGETWGKQDDRWQRNVAECERVGIPWGAYLYSYATDVTEANQEADRAVNTLNAAQAKGYKPTLPIYYDLEDKTLPSDPAALAQIARAFCGRVQSAGYTAGVYANLNWWRTRLTDPVFNSWDRWVAQYNVSCDYKGTYSAWQYTSSGAVPGISGNVDMNYWYGMPFTDESSLDEMANEYRNVLPDDTYAIVAGSGIHRMALEVGGAATFNGANVQIWSSNATNAQRWKVTHDASGYVTFTNLASNKVLEISSGLSKPGANVAQFEANGTKAQKWVVVPDGSGFRIVSALNRELVLDVDNGAYTDGTNVKVFTPNGSEAQRFSFFDATPSVAAGDVGISEENLYSIEPVSAPGKAVDIASGSMKNGANAQIYASNKTFAQLFSFSKVGGFYQIRNANSALVLDVDKGDVVPGANVQQWESSSNNANAQFATKHNSDGTYSFINRASGLALTANGAENCSNVSAEVYTGGSNQRFRLVVREHLIDNGIYSITAASNPTLMFDVQSASTDDDAPIQLYASNGTFSQTWSISLVEGTKNTYTIESLASGKRLSCSSAGAAVQTTPSAAIEQRWIATVFKGSFVFKNEAHPSYSLGVATVASGSRLTLGSYDDLTLASFKLKPANDTVVFGGYYIAMASAPKTVVDVANGSMSNKANVQLYTKNGTNAQKWVFKNNDDGTYTIMNAGSGKVLDVVNGQAFAGANVQQYESNGSRAQRWYVGYRGGGFKITSALNTAFCLDVANASSSNGTNLQLYTSNNTRGAQRFVLIPTSYEMAYHGFQNPAQYYQVSNKSVTIPHLGEGIFGYRTISRISSDATKQDCINAMITRAYDYLGTKYIWDYACAPGVGVDCAGLVMQSLYAVGMDVSPMNPWDHYYTPGHDQYANFMWENGRFQKLSFSQRQRGDLISYKGHVAIYLGNDQIIEAYPHVGVRIANVYAPGTPHGVMRVFV